MTNPTRDSELGTRDSSPDSEPEERGRLEGLILDDLTEQLDRTRQLLLGNPEEAAQRAFARMGGETEAQARIAVELAARTPLAQPDRFPEAHRLVMHSLEVLDREGFRNPRVPRLGPLKPLAEVAVEFVTEYIVKSYAQKVVDRLRSLYQRREVQSVPGSPERKLLAGRRVEMDRIALAYAGGKANAPLLVGAGAAIPLFGAITQYFGAIDFTSQRVLFIALALSFVVIFALTWILLRGAAVAHRRSRLIMEQPLLALWETIGHCGNPPRDESVHIATYAIIVTTLIWLVLPGAAIAVYYLA